MSVSSRWQAAKREPLENDADFISLKVYSLSLTYMKNIIRERVVRYGSTASVQSRRD